MSSTAPCRRQRGFSLIEVMIVLVIIGIATTAVTLAVAPDPREALRRDARELAMRLGAAQQEVRVDGRVVVWTARDEGYEFVRGTWVQVPGHVVPMVSTAGALDRFEGDDMLRPRAWRSGQVQVHPAAPLLLTSEWVGTPFEMELRQGTQAVLITRDGRGRFEVR